MSADKEMRDHIAQIKLSAENDSLKSEVLYMVDITARFIIDRYISPDRAAEIKAMVDHFIREEMRNRYPSRTPSPNEWVDAIGKAYQNGYDQAIKEKYW